MRDIREGNEAEAVSSSRGERKGTLEGREGVRRRQGEWGNRRDYCN